MKYKNTFMFQGVQYPIYSIVRLNNLGRKVLETNLECVQIISHYTTQKQSKYYTNEVEHIWTYQTKWKFGNNGVLLPNGAKRTDYTPDDLIKEIVMVAPLPGVEEGMQDQNMASYWHADIVWEWCKCAFICFTACVFKSWSLKGTIWLIVCLATHFKCDNIHGVYISASIKTFETQFRITKKIVMDLYFNPQNIHVDKPGEFDDSLKKYKKNNKKGVLV